MKKQILIACLAIASIVVAQAEKAPADKAAKKASPTKSTSGTGAQKPDVPDTLVAVLSARSEAFNNVDIYADSNGTPVFDKSVIAAFKTEPGKYQSNMQIDSIYIRVRDNNTMQIITYSEGVPAITLLGDLRKKLIPGTRLQYVAAYTSEGPRWVRLIDLIQLDKLPESNWCIAKTEGVLKPGQNQLILNKCK